MPIPQSKKIINTKNESMRQFIRFVIIGVINTGIDFAVYILLTRGLSFFSYHLSLAKTISFAAAATFSLFANRRWTFKKTDSLSLGEAVKFYLAAVINIGIHFISVHVFKLNDIIGFFIASATTMIIGFLLSKFWVFKK